MVSGCREVRFVMNGSASGASAQPLAASSELFGILAEAVVVAVVKRATAFFISSRLSRVDRERDPVARAPFRPPVCGRVAEPTSDETWAEHW